MRNFCSILILYALLMSCAKTKPTVASFTFDRSQISNEEIHTYQYHGDGRIKTERVTHFICDNGKPFDSTVVMKVYVFDDKGRLSIIDDLSDSIRQIKTYNASDSLTGEYSITTHGDTIYEAITDFQNGRAISKNSRILNYNYNQGQDPLTQGTAVRFDTLFERQEFVYQNNMLAKVIIKDIGGRTIGAIEYTYDGAVRTKATRYSESGDVRTVKEITHYYPNELNESDAYSLGANGDTLGYRRTVMENNLKRVLKYFADAQTSETIYYNDKGQRIGSVLFNLQDKSKFLYQYAYDDHGNKLEESYYLVKADTARHAAP